MKKTIFSFLLIFLTLQSAEAVQTMWYDSKCDRCWVYNQYFYCLYSRRVVYDDETCGLTYAYQNFKDGWMMVNPPFQSCPEWGPSYGEEILGDYPTEDYVGGCGVSPRQYDCSPTHTAYDDVQDFQTQFSDMTQWGYFTSESGGNTYKCMATYKNSQGSMVEHSTSDYHAVDPASSTDCLSEDAFTALNNTDCEQTPNAFNTGIYTTYNDSDATYGCLDGNGDGADDSTGVACNVTAYHRPEGELGSPDENAGKGNNRECAEGAPTWSVNMVNMNLYLTDIPLWYDPPIGPSIRVQLSYNSQTPAGSGKPFGYKWTFNYNSYLDEDATSGVVTVLMPDGRQDVFTPDGGTGYINEAGVFNALTKIAANDFTLELLDGTVYVHNRQSITTSSETLITEIRDAYREKLTLTYKIGTDQLEKITDALNRDTTFVDGNSDGYIERVDDPFGRSAHFEFTNGSLTKITDMGGYWAELTYDANSYIQTLKNDNGTWKFKIEPSDGTVNIASPYPAPGEPMGGNYRITITDPLRNKEEYYSFGTYSWYVSPRDYIPHTSPDSNNYKSAKKTFYFLTESLQTEKISKIQNPEGGYIEYKDFDAVSQKPRIIKDFHGSGVTHTVESHTTHLTYNPKGRILTSTDAKGNIYKYFYYPNNIDVQDIKVELANSPGTDITLQSLTYNGSTHDISTITERPSSLNITTEFTYNSKGQIELITQAKGTSVESVTDLVYYPAAHASEYELSEIKINGNTVDSFTYDSVGRVDTHTDARGIVLNYDYSNLDKITQITYPDTKTEIIAYSQC